MTNLSWRNYLRIGLILGVTGIIVLIHSSITSTGRLPHNEEIIIGIVLVVVGLPLVVMGVVRRRQSYGL